MSLTWLWSALGLVGSALVALAAPDALAQRLSSAGITWLYRPTFLTGAGTALAWTGMTLLAVAWLAIWRRPPDRRTATLIGAVWILPLVLAPPLFSRDIYSYIAQGTILHLGHNPYHDTPAALAGLGRGDVLRAVSPYWRHTTAPYGPLFLELVSLIVGIVGHNLVAGVVLVRVLNLIGIALLAVSVPAIAGSLGSSGSRRGASVWIAVASPLTILTLVTPGRNDALMAGLLAAGVAIALRGSPLGGVAVCALAGTVKVPALVGAVFIAVAWARAEPSRARQARLLAGSAAVAVIVLGAVTLASGVGLGWLSASLYSTPADVRLAITPATAIGYTVAKLLALASVHVDARRLESVFGVVTTVLCAGIGVWLLARVRRPRVVALLGACLLLAAAGGPAAWPWYFSWGLVLIAACAAPQQSPALALAVVAAAFLDKPSGQLVLPLRAAPWVLLAYVLIAAWAWSRSRLRSRTAWGDRAGNRAGIVSSLGDLGDLAGDVAGGDREADRAIPSQG